LAASIAMLTYQLDYVLPTAKFVPQYRGGAGAYAAGYIILIMIQVSEYALDDIVSVVNFYCLLVLMGNHFWQ
jgi:hypothetical protein